MEYTFNIAEPDFEAISEEVIGSAFRVLEIVGVPAENIAEAFAQASEQVLKAIQENRGA